MSVNQSLLTPDEFRDRALARRAGLCCVPGCGAQAQAAHRLLDGRLWPDGGYYLDNGVPLCNKHQDEAASTALPVEQLRSWCGIQAPVLPPQFEEGERLDAWGNPVLPSGQRLRGELFLEPDVQDHLARGGFLDRFTHWCKYPRTYHMPFSPGASSDDKILPGLDHFRGRRVIGTIKKDGENATLYRDHYHARSLNSKHHPSRDWIKGFWNAVRHDIPEEWRVCGENLFARHSIGYTDLRSFFYGFSVWNERNVCLDWDATLEWFSLIGSSAGLHIEPVEMVYDGLFDEQAVRRICEDLVGRGEEGMVLRVADAFAYRDFRYSAAKYVRADHVQTDQHWMHREVVANSLAG